jgi:hypothetical protein
MPTRGTNAKYSCHRIQFGLSRNAEPEGTEMVSVNGTAKGPGVIVEDEKLQVAPAGIELAKHPSLIAYLGSPVFAFSSREYFTALPGDVVCGRGSAAEGTVTIRTEAVPKAVESAWEIALTTTVAGDGTAVGAEYKPEVETVPNVALPPVTPFTCQVTALLLVPVTVALKACVVLV